MERYRECYFKGDNINMKVLILGYGSAGKRHHKYIQQLIGYDVIFGFYDPDKSTTADLLTKHVYSNDVLYALHAELWDLVVIASPPDQHIEQIFLVLHNAPNAYVVCEKPVSSHGSLGDIEIIKTLRNARKIGFAFNYRWNENINKLRMLKRNSSVIIQSSQYRKKIPTWGFVLDHIAHSVDIVRYLTGCNSINVEKATKCRNIEHETIYVEGYADSVHFTFEDRVWYHEVDRVAKIKCGNEIIDIDAPEQMFLNMWNDFLVRVEHGLHMNPGIFDVWKTQAALDDINNMIEDISEC